MKVDIEVSTAVSRSGRARQLEAMFDVPPNDVATMHWSGEFPDLETEPWNVGLIVGPSGAGKSTLLREMFGAERKHRWSKQAVIDDFAKQFSIDDIAHVCQAVGFNTIPSWMKPHGVLSNGERFRVGLARTLLETPADDVIVVDEFTSVVDRQVAQIGSHAVQKYVRRNNRQVVLASCHYDIVDWLRPDWILEPHTMQLTRLESVQPRPKLAVEVARVDYKAWQLFAPFHYLTRSLNRTAKCYVLFVDDRPAAFAGVLHRPHPKVSNVKGLSRIVTLPDWQGLGLAFALTDTIASVYKRDGYRFRTYPAHPMLVRSFHNSPNYRLVSKATATGHQRNIVGNAAMRGSQGARPNAVYEYVGPVWPDDDARALIA